MSPPHANLLETLTAAPAPGSRAFRRIGATLAAEPERFVARPLRELAAAAGVSEPTLIRFCRHHGYPGLPHFRIALAMALARQLPGVEPAVEDKSMVNRAAKRAIGALAARLADGPGHIIIDSGSTAQAMAEALREAPGLTIWTTGLNVVQTLRGARQHRLLLPGGAFHAESNSLVGRAVEASLATMRFDAAFIGADSIDPAHGLSTFTEEEAHQTMAMIAAAGRTIVLADHTKFAAPALHRICGITQVHGVVSDAALPAATAAALRAQGVDVFLAEEPSL